VAFLLMKTQNNNIVFYDGTCGLCSRFVLFILKNDHYNVFKFAPLNGNTFEVLNVRYNFSEASETVILVYNNQVYYRSDAALKILSQLRIPLNFLSVFLIVPSFFRNIVYVFVAKNRKKWFGLNNHCRLLPAEVIKDKFLD
jgi:predicted DCC family thiol-disulfide oxidoreductase YuxK